MCSVSRVGCHDATVSSGQPDPTANPATDRDYPDNRLMADDLPPDRLASVFAEFVRLWQAATAFPRTATAIFKRGK